MINEWKDRCFEEDGEEEQRQNDIENDTLFHDNNDECRLGRLNIGSAMIATDLRDSSGVDADYPNDDSSLPSASCSAGRNRMNPFALSLSWSTMSSRSSRNPTSSVGPYRLW